MRKYCAAIVAALFATSPAMAMNFSHDGPCNPDHADVGMLITGTDLIYVNEHGCRVKGGWKRVGEGSYEAELTECLWGQPEPGKEEPDQELDELGWRILPDMKASFRWLDDERIIYSIGDIVVDQIGWYCDVDIPTYN